MCLTSYWFSFKLNINITFSFTNNHSLHKQFVKFICKKVCIFSITLIVLLQYFNVNTIFKLTSTAYIWYDGHSTSINVCEVWGGKDRCSRLQKGVSHTYTRVEQNFYFVYKKKNTICKLIQYSSFKKKKKTYIFKFQTRIIFQFKKKKKKLHS